MASFLRMNLSLKAFFDHEFLQFGRRTCQLASPFKSGTHMMEPLKWQAATVLIIGAKYLSLC